MGVKKAAALAGIWLAGCGAALGQTVNSGTEVTVNPVLGGRGGVVLYPGSDYLRTVPPALMPGETAKDLGPIQLHMPTKRRVTVRRAEAAEPARTAEAAPAPEKPKPAPPKPKETAVAKASPPPPKPAPAPAAPPSGYNPYDFGMAGAAGLNLGGTPVPAQAPPARTASANPPPANVTKPPPAEGQTPGLSKRSVILFAPQAADPAESALGAIKVLAGDLNHAMTTASARVQLQAYGGNRGDKGSDARRLSLKRALAIRQALIDDGVSADRIDVRAMGGVDDGGPADRVDVFVKS
jgi:outer membrane protein OmpA-like peptidoglycan-associated protein